MPFLLSLFVFVFVGCTQPHAEAPVAVNTLPNDTLQPVPASPDQSIISTGNTTPQQLLDYAQTLIGVPYQYGSTNPQNGFDCSGFITHVFNHFDIEVPRSSVDFTTIKREVALSAAKPGDLVLFTGTDSTRRIVGHMGIITTVADDEVSFIHSSSGKANGVTITPMNRYYQGRFMKVIRVFRQND